MQRSAQGCTEVPREASLACGMYSTTDREETTQHITMDDAPFEAYEGNKRVKWNPMYPAETWNSRKMTEYIRLFGTWQSAPCSLNLAVLPRILQLEKVGEYYNPHDFLARVDVTSAIFKISF